MTDAKALEETRATAQDLDKVEQALTKAAAAILEQPTKSVERIVGVAVSKIAAAGVMTGTLGAIGLFGTAGTGTAIASLSGAAFNTASLYWVGSIFGFGAVGGGVVLTGGALAAAIPVGLYVRKRLFSRGKDPQSLSSPEQAMLYAALRLASAARAERINLMSAIERREPMARAAKRAIDFFFQVGVEPLLADLRHNYARERGNPRRIPLTFSSGARMQQTLHELPQVTRKYLDR